MWLLLCSSDDRPALWAAGQLRARGLAPLVVLTPELLHYSRRWQHRLGNDGPPITEFTLADGRCIRGGEVRGVLNRISALPPALFERMPAADQSYALQEWTALHISWLSALEAPVLNLPVMHGLCGAWRHISEWTWLAARAGLRTRPFTQDVRADASAPQAVAAWKPPRPAGAVRTVFVIDGTAIDDTLPGGTRAACGRLGTLAATRLLGVHLDAATHAFVDASPRPDLRAGGARLADALHLALSGRG